MEAHKRARAERREGAAHRRRDARSASPSAAPPARPSSTSPARRGSAAACSTTTSGPRSGCWSRSSAATPRSASPASTSALAKAKTVDDVLDVLVASLTDMIENEPGFFLLLYELFSAGRRNPDIQREVGQLFERTRSHVAEVLRGEGARGRAQASATTPRRSSPTSSRSATASPCRRSPTPSATSTPPSPPAPPRPVTCSSPSSAAELALAAIDALE